MIEPDPFEAPAPAFPETDLGRRLLRRGTESIGVVDLRHAFALYSRAALLALGRFGFLSELRRRYGAERRMESPAGLVFRNSAREHGHFPIAASGAPHAQSQAAPITAPTLSPNAVRTPTDPAMELATAKVYRVRRTRPPRDASEPETPPRAAATPAPAVRTQAGRPDSMATPVEDRRSIPPAPEAGAPIGAADVRVAGPPAAQAAATAPRGAVGEPDAQPHDSRSAEAPLIFARREIVMPRSAPVDPQPEPGAGPNLASPLPLRAIRPLTEAGSLPSSASGPREDGRRSWPNSDPHSPQGGDAATSVPPVAPPGAPARPLSERPAQPAPVAAEIRPALPRSPSPPIVWRKPQPERESRDALPQTMFAAPAMDGGRTFSPAGANEAFGQRTAPPTAAFSEAGSTDVAQIARQVSRAIARELRIHRERRGRTR